MLVQLLKDVHVHTWHVLSARPGITRTRRGTRPGSPLADVIFHVAMFDVIIALNEWVENQGSYQEVLQMIDAPMEAVVWSDDLAIAWLTQRAEELPAAIECLLQQIHTKRLRFKYGEGQNDSTGHISRARSSCIAQAIPTLDSHRHAMPTDG